MDLFEYAKEKAMEEESPLASRLRPSTLEEVVGQTHIVGKDKLLYRAIKADREDDLGKGHCKHDQRQLYTDQRHCGWKERYGSGDQAGAE